MARPNKDNYADTALRPRERDDGPPEPPPPYTCADTGPPPALTLAGKRPRRVAMLDHNQPAEGFRYLDHTTWYIDDLNVFNQRSNLLKALVVGVHRMVKCKRRSAELLWKPRYTDRTMTTLVPSPLDELGPGEMERASGIRYDWTRECEFSLFLRSRSRTTDGRGWTAFACLFFNSLSPHGDLAIPWKDLFKTRSVESDIFPSRHGRRSSKEKWLKFTWQFRESTPRPRWGASIIVYYRDPRGAEKGSGNVGPPLGFDNPWAHIDPTLTHQAEMNHRVSLKSYKKIMFYHEELGYGNDVLDQPVEARRAEHKERYVEFASRFLPRGD